jgi:hypothetical protein
MPELNIKTGIAIAGALLLIYIIFSMKKFLNSPVGSALSKLLTEAGALLTALASLPPWLLIGLGATYLLGYAVLKLSPSSVKDLVKSVKEANDKIAKDGDITSPEAIDAAGKGAAGVIVEDALTKEAAADPSNAERAAAVDKVIEARAAVAQEIPPENAEDYSRGEEVGNEVIEPDG